MAKAKHEGFRGLGEPGVGSMSSSSEANNSGLSSSADLTDDILDADLILRSFGISDDYGNQELKEDLDGITMDQFIGHRQQQAASQAHQLFAGQHQQTQLITSGLSPLAAEMSSHNNHHYPDLVSPGLLSSSCPTSLSPFTTAQSSAFISPSILWASSSSSAASPSSSPTVLIASTSSSSSSTPSYSTNTATILNNPFALHRSDDHQLSPPPLLLQQPSDQSRRDGPALLTTASSTFSPASGVEFRGGHVSIPMETLQALLGVSQQHHQSRQQHRQLFLRVPPPPTTSAKERVVNTGCEEQPPPVQYRPSGGAAGFVPLGGVSRTINGGGPAVVVGTSQPAPDNKSSLIGELLQPKQERPSVFTSTSAAAVFSMPSPVLMSPVQLEQKPSLSNGLVESQPATTVLPSSAASHAQPAAGGDIRLADSRSWKRSGRVTPTGKRSRPQTPTSDSESGSLEDVLRESHGRASSGRATPVEVKHQPRLEDMEDEDKYNKRKRSTSGGDKGKKDPVKQMLEQLQKFIPHIGNPEEEKVSHAGLLVEGSDYIRSLMSEHNANKDNVEALKLKIEELNAEIEAFQAQLPEHGTPSIHRIISSRGKSIPDMFADHVRQRTQEDWRYWVFTSIMGHFVHSFAQEVSNISPEEMERDALQWVQERMSLQQLRKDAFRKLAKLCSKTSIMEDPSRLPAEARGFVALPEYVENPDGTFTHQSVTSSILENKESYSVWATTTE